jgi:hypothetical protein
MSETNTGRAGGGPTDEMLMAYADGEASPAEAEAVEEAVAADPAVAERLALFAETRALAAEAMPLEPVPDSLRASVEAMIAAAPTSGAANDAVPPPEPDGENVVAFRPRGGRAIRRPVFMAMAATVAGIAVAVGAFVAGLGIGGGAAPTGGGEGVSRLATLPLEEGLSLPSGAEVALDGQVLRTMSSFRSGTGEFCREFEVEGERNLVGVACRRDGDWSVDFAVATAPADPTAYAPASGLEALDAYLGTIAAGPPLPSEEEMEALDQVR